MDNKIKINLNKMSDIKKFTEIVRGYASDIDLLADRFIIDAKSVLGIYTVDLSQDVYVRIISADENECARFAKDMEAFA